MRNPTIKMKARLVMLTSVIALLFAVGTMIGTTAPVSAASAKRTGATTSSAKTTTVVSTTMRIKTAPEKSADYGPNGALYDSCSGSVCYNYHDDGYRTFYFNGSNEVQSSEFTYYGE